MIELKLQLLTIKKDNQTFDEFIMKIKTIVDSLIAIGELVQLNNLILYAIYGLNDMYNIFLCSVTITMEEFNTRLLVYEHRLLQEDKHEK